VRGRWGVTLALAVFWAGSGAATAPGGDGGGRDVTVALFSTHPVHALTVTPVGAHSWVAHCAGCAHEPLTAALHLVAPAEIFAGGTLRVTEDGTGDGRVATGLWHVRGSRAGGEIDVVLTLPSERYIAAVLNAEAAAAEPAQSLRALAILARTYALNGKHNTAHAGHLEADLCDSTACQAMALRPASQAIEEAAAATAGETLWFGGHRAEVFFSQSCGGVTEDAGAAWPNLRGATYLRSHADPYCVRRDAAAWHAEVSLQELAEIARAEGWHLPAGIVSARVTERSASHRALRIVFTGSDGRTSAVAASALRFGIGRALGWNRVRSDAYELTIRNGSLVFDGRGHGHGVGLCQAGATEMAAEGKTAREILGFYFPGTAVRIQPGDEGWLESRAGALAVRAAYALPDRQKAALEESWSEAQGRFPPRKAVSLEMVFAPTTEVFRQLTSQPGWTLASARGNSVVLQPEAILRAHGQSVPAIALHEMLHVLVETEASERAPLWLREGLVEALAGEGEKGAGSISIESVDEIESALAHADSLQASARAHRAAEVRVRGLLSRYGLSTVRGWLASGVPVGVS